jgi:hypothetical protein
MKLYLLVKILLCSVCISSSAWAASPLIVKHYQQQARYEFGIKVLDLALSKLGDEYQIVGPETLLVNEGRGELLVIDGTLDIEFQQTTMQREASMIPIKIPLYRGLLGLRLLLIKPELNDKFKKINSIDDLRQFTGGHGAHWADLPVYAANDLKVTTSVQYRNLFKMLKRGRFDYFHRGVNEIWGELDRHENDFIIADNIMFFYPHPVYFFVGMHRPELAKKIEKGLRIALADGSFKALFIAYFHKTISLSNFASRKLIILKNPLFTSDMPIDTSWWMP